MMMMIVSTRVADTAIFLSFFFFRLLANASKHVCNTVRLSIPHKRCCWFLTFVIIAVLFSPGWFDSLLVVWCTSNGLARPHAPKRVSRSHTHTQFRLTRCHWKVHASNASDGMRIGLNNSSWVWFSLSMRYHKASMEHNQSETQTKQ